MSSIRIYQTYDSVAGLITPYAPLASAFFSAVSIFFAYLIASKARSISAEQKKIAAQKLDLDIFDKRYAGIKGLISLKNLFSEVVNKYSYNISDKNTDKMNSTDVYNYISDLSKKYNDLYREIMMNPLIFSNMDSATLYVLDQKMAYLYGTITGTVFFTCKDNVKLNDKSYTGTEAYGEFKRVFDEVDHLLVSAVKNILPRYSPFF
ncbi:hypothetical protein [Gluconobacter japonicus]|uniref:hypothetical protein n=1 Tax=Gluconobacter japonicus TaxID=376620 RepID=UPI0011AF6082|nr:hypothetical protein [Gluconobacter japonicus]GBR20238.1 hypothetical protein AA3271_0678 [Gluconobacter japonicus NBRC 3271]